jgi:hypothetical protein
MTEIIDIKLLAVNGGAFAVSCCDYLEPMLKILLLAATLGYTLHKWYRLYKKKK